MSSQSFISHRKDDETMRLEILTNICRMMVSRGRIDISKYCLDEHKDVDFIDINYHLSSMIDNSKFLSMFAERSDKSVYTIDVDVPFEDERDKNETFDGTKLVVSLIPQKITDIKNSDMINDIFKTYPHHHKVFIVDAIVEKANIALSRNKNVEVFLKDNVTIDLMSFDEAPHRCALDKGGADVYVVKPNAARILENDPLAKYYNAKLGDTLQIIGNTVTNGFERRYRVVIDAKDVFGK
jgi:hypothetical protein